MLAIGLKRHSIIVAASYAHMYTLPIFYTKKFPRMRGVTLDLSAKHFRRVACRAPGHLASHLAAIPLAAGRSQALLF